MFESAAAVAEVAREFARDTEAARALAPPVLAAAKDAGLLRSGLPVELGGTLATPEAILRSAETVARGDASAGWCVSIAATSSLLAAYLPPEGAQEVFGPPDVVAAGVWAPRGKARAVDGGGIVVFGRWAFCSGIPHADWLFAGCVLDGVGPRVAAIPKAELEVLDTWRTGGLRGTGSHDCVAREVFVPEHRVLSVLDGPRDDSPLYRFPVFGFFALSIAVAALGNARGAVDDLTALAVDKRSTGSSRTLAERAQTQAEVARAEASLRAARLLVFDAVDRAWQEAQGTDPVSESARTGLRLAATHATRTSAEVVTSMYDLGAGAAIYEDSPLQRRFRDAHTATAHFQVNPASYELAGRLLLGLPTRTEQL
ncbi:acyl-CoA dehydrogenase family protein [Umezawaea sp. Da 62-37]|uniref:acyl-CoA dehydrogenase family protein n=1 Tax=Umezawaea sp. Da 62-37 TaxID=3075927 RepID=UPI0028F74F35|nr:acyl-CoA dehydrogenase family protein [Umezawaea sp. Da 62-37]WNV84445.1 acyl-CoA dehydrogenase family protein [Umezawaea sp. Da 62-37]